MLGTERIGFKVFVLLPSRFSILLSGMIARVTLEIAVGKEFDYRVPKSMKDAVLIGSRVKVPFGARRLMGVVTGLAERSQCRDLRDLLGVVGLENLVTPKVLSLARWMAEYYCCPVETALKSVLPDAVRREKEGWRKQLFVRALPQLSKETPKLSARQKALWRTIRERREMRLQEFIQTMSTTAQTVRRLEDKGLVAISPRVMDRDPFAHETILPTQKLALNEAQKAALKHIVQACDNDKPCQRTFLLHGVTGSGKTEVYLQAIEHCLSQGKGAIVLVPEISLTPQTVERFKARFNAGTLRTLTAVLHHKLSSGERHDEWHKIRQGRARIAIGARSAVFAPVHPLGLVIVDEEHESSYKQEEAPRYHARDVAVLRAHREQAIAVLGSATPSMESYYHAQRGKYQLLQLPHRADAKTLPLVRVIDMRTTARKETGAIFSPKLKEAITARLQAGEQTMLFLNRRGYSASLQCPLCGYVAGCPHCNISLTFHRQPGQLRCHVCGHAEPAPQACPQSSCQNPQIRFAGIGTQRVEETLRKLFPKARVQRMDSDALKRKEDYRRILHAFRQGKIDILLGTQMIAKGLHFPNVTLVGIIHADLSLHFPDFRAGERTFQLLTQVAGRAGRGDVEGEVFVQAFTPFHPAIQYARQHDYIGFYEQEIEFRQELGYPPIKRLCALTLRGRNEDKTRLAAEHLKKVIEKNLVDFNNWILAGPAPAALLRAEDFFRYQLTLRANRMAALSKRLQTLIQETPLPEDIRLSIDVDPAHL